MQSDFSKLSIRKRTRQALSLSYCIATLYICKLNICFDFFDLMNKCCDSLNIATIFKLCKFKLKEILIVAEFSDFFERWSRQCWDCDVDYSLADESDSFWNANIMKFSFFIFKRNNPRNKFDHTWSCCLKQGMKALLSWKSDFFYFSFISGNILCSCDFELHCFENTTKQFKYKNKREKKQEIWLFSLLILLT